MKHDNDTIVRDICIATGAVTAACIASLATTAKYLFHFCIDTQWKRSVFHQSLIAPERIEKLQQGEAQEAGEWFAQAKQPVTITSDDGLRLHGWLFDPDCTAPKPHLYAICMHGYTGVPEETAKWAHRYARMGFTVLVPSQRAQDLSEGRYVGMGWLERNDLLNWIDLIASSDADARILLYGGSMGRAMWCPRLSIAATRLRAWCSSTAFGIRRVCRNRLPRYVWMPRDCSANIMQGTIFRKPPVCSRSDILSFRCCSFMANRTTS